METGQGIGHGIEFQPLQLVILDEDGNTKKTGGRKTSVSAVFKTPDDDEISELAAAREHLIPISTLGFRADRGERSQKISLEKLAARRPNRGSRACLLIARNRNPQSANAGRRGAGAGHIRYRPNLCLSPRGLGSESSFLYLCGASKSPFVLDAGEPTLGIYLPKGARIYTKAAYRVRKV